MQKYFQIQNGMKCSINVMNLFKNMENYHHKIVQKNMRTHLGSGSHKRYDTKISINA